jgi:hypothetical protein
MIKTGINIKDTLEWESLNIELDSSSSLTSSYLYAGVSDFSGNFRTTPIHVYFFATSNTCYHVYKYGE